MHGAGNDYIYVNTLLYNIDEPSELARLWSDRHKGIGADGLVLIGRSPIPEADFSMRIFNADGSEAMMCGNACRCIGKYLYERTHLWPLPCMEGNGYQETVIRLLTLSGIKLLFLHIVNGIVESVTVDMGEPVFDSPLFKPLPQGGEALAANLPSPQRGVGGEALDSLFVSMGNPHYVIFTDDVDAVEVQGRELEHHPAFPERANIEFAEMRPDGIRHSSTRLGARKWYHDGLRHRSLCCGCGCIEDGTGRQDKPHHHGRRHARSRMARARQSRLSVRPGRVRV